MVADEARERQRLAYITRSIALIENYTAGGKAAFLADPMVQDAVLRRLETLTDATSKLSPGLQARHPSIPWRPVHGFRNIAAHAYEGLDLHRVWETVEHYLPALRAAMEEELARGRTTEP